MMARLRHKRGIVEVGILKIMNAKGRRGPVR